MTRVPMYIEGDGTPRRWGLSTRQAMMAIMQAWLHPNTYVVVEDHIRSRSGRDVQFEYIDTIIARLELQGFRMNRTNSTIIFEGYELIPLE